MIPVGPVPAHAPFTEDNGRPSTWIRWFSQFEQAFNQSQGIGSTALRPNPAPFVGFMYWDLTLGKPVWAKTLTTYVDATGAPA